MQQLPMAHPLATIEAPQNPAARCSTTLDRGRDDTDRLPRARPAAEIEHGVLDRGPGRRPGTLGRAAAWSLLSEVPATAWGDIPAVRSQHRDRPRRVCHQLPQMSRRLESQPGLGTAKEHTSPGESFPRGLPDTQLIEARSQSLPALLADQAINGPKVEAEEGQLLGADDAALMGRRRKEPV